MVRIGFGPDDGDAAASRDRGEGVAGTTGLLDVTPVHTLLYDSALVACSIHAPMLPALGSMDFLRLWCP